MGNHQYSNAIKNLGPQDATKNPKTILNLSFPAVSKI